MTTLARNDVRQYDELQGEWWRPGGELAALHWLAASRAALVPPPREEGATLVDVGCGGGLLAPHLRGYRHLGVDLAASALQVASRHGVTPVRGDASRLPLADDAADVVVAGEVLEHVPHPERLVQEAMRVLRPGGRLVFDTIARTLLARVALVWAGERMPGGPPRRIHDPRLFVPVERLRRLLEEAGAERVEMWGLRPSLPGYLAFLADRSRPVRMVRTGLTGALYQGVAWKG